MSDHGEETGLSEAQVEEFAREASEAVDFTGNHEEVLTPIIQRIARAAASAQQEKDAKIAEAIGREYLYPGTSVARMVAAAIRGGSND